MIEVGAVWHDDKNVHYIRHTSKGRVLESVPAKWSLFLDCSDIPDDTVLALARIPYIRLSREGENGRYARIDAIPQRGSKDRLRDVRDGIRDRLRERFGVDAIREGDVNPATRWIADNPDVSLATTLKILYLDIEAQSPSMGIDDTREGRARILSYAAQGSDGMSWSEVLLPDDPRHADNIPESEIDRAEIQLIRNLLGVMARYDAVAAWNGGDVRDGLGFDFDTIRARSERFGIQFRDAFPKRDGKIRYEIRWESILWIDHLAVYKKYKQGEVSYKLDAIAKRHGLSGKTGFDTARVYEIWATGPAGRREVLDYNIQDTALLQQIEERSGYLDLHFTVCRLCNQTPHTRALKATQQADGYLLRFSGLRGFRWPTNWWDDDPPEDETEGAFVFDTSPGLWENVSIVDFAALYPSIMLSLNIGPDTVATDARDFAGAVYCESPHPSCSSVFRLDKQSHFQMALKTLIENRARYKTELKRVVPGSAEYNHFQSLSQAAKIVANSFYGVLLCKQYRYFSAPAGHAVTSTGQWLIKTVAEHFESNGRGWKIVGGDTDSVFVHTVRPTILPRGSEQVEHGDRWGDVLAPEGRILRDEIARINAAWPSLLARHGVKESYIKLEWEMTLARWLGIRKKCYAGTADYVDGKRTEKPWVHKYRGLAVRRGDRVAIAKKVQIAVLEAVLGKETDPVLPPVPSDDEMRLLIETWRERVLESPLELDDIVMRQGIRKPLADYRREAAFTSRTCKGCRHRFESQSWPDETHCPVCGLERARRKPPAHVLLAEEMSRRGESPLVGDKIAYVYTYDPTVKGDGWTAVRLEDLQASGGGSSDWRDKLDRAQYWYSAYSPAHTVLAVSHPDGGWIDPKKERAQLYAEKRREYNKATAGSGGLFDVLDLLGDPGSIFEV